MRGGFEKGEGFLLRWICGIERKKGVIICNGMYVRRNYANVQVRLLYTVLTDEEMQSRFSKLLILTSLRALLP